MESNVAPALSVQSFDLVYGNPDTDPQVQDTTLQVSPELATLLTRAVAANKDSGGMQLSFDALLIAMVTGGDPLCRWLREHLELRGVPRETIARQRSLQPAELAQSYLERDGQQRLSQRPRATSSARTALETAESLRSEISGNKPLDIRHLMAAYAVIEGYHDEDFEKLRIDRRAWCLSLAERLASIYPDEARQWANYAQRAPGVPLTAFDSDMGARRNLLDIERDVEAFAMLIASRATSTPLSIGIFGAWGSGKTFFLRQLRARIATLAYQARAIETNPDSRKATPFYGRIAQVEFNAWHYNESNLVASLVEHVFRNLQFADENEIELDRRRDELLSKIAVEQGKVDAVKADVNTADAQVAARTNEVNAVETQIKNTEDALKQHEQAAEQARLELAKIVAAAP
ncbi:MAG TPA: P-loop NTPase fold protein, partial [Terriglobia bacterium]|nr:P-loop NTPase fold protein [Terriglobia bacterium]